MNRLMFRNSATISLVILFLFCFISGGKSIAQTTLVFLEGTVTDDQGSTLSAATIILRNMETGYEHKSISRSDGTYIISGVEPGRYEIEVGLPGFITQIRKGMTLSVGAELTIDFVLAPATIEEEIVITAEAPMVEVTKAEISSVIDRNIIEELPLLNRDFADLTILKAGVLWGRTNALPGGLGEVLIDGISNEHMINNTPRMPVPADAIQEFRVLTQQYEAEYGNAAGMIRNAITRSGTNQLRGRVSFFYRDEMFDTPNYFVNHDGYQGDKIKDVELPDYKHNNLSGFIGGPIKKDRAHFFIAYEGLFKETYNTITSPLVPNETISAPERTHNLLLKLNYQLNEKNLFSFHYSMLREIQENLGVGGLFTKERAYDNPWYGDDVRLSWTFFPSGKTMNELRLLVATDRFAWKTEYPESYSIERPSGYFGKATNVPQSGWTKRFQVLDHFSLFLRNHNIKLGFDFHYFPAGGNVTFFHPGSFQFETDDTFDPTDPFTFPTMFMAMLGDRIFNQNSQQFSLFAQDSWKVTRRLTLNLGLRFFYHRQDGLLYKTFHFPGNLNPRFAFSWDPIGDGRTSVRGGFGIFAGNLMGNASFMQLYLTQVSVRIIMYPNYPDPNQANPYWPFWESLLGMPPGFLAQQNMSMGFGTWRSMEDQVVPYSTQTTLGIHREITADLAASADFIWSRGHHLLRMENENPVIVGTKTQRQDPTKGDEWVITDGGRSDYKGFLFSLTKRHARGWSLDVSYTLSWSKSDTDFLSTIQNYEADGWERQFGYAGHDARHKFTAAGVFDLPLKFQLSGIIFYQSKAPWTAYYGYDENLDGLNSDYLDYNRNSRRGFDLFYINARISKFIDIKRLRLQLFGEAYNVFNRANFYSVLGNELSPDFGNPTQAHDPRLIQLGVRVDF